MTAGFEPRFAPKFAPSTAGRRVALLGDERTERMPDRRRRDRADTVRILPPKRQASAPVNRQVFRHVVSIPSLLKLVVAGIVIGSVFALVYVYSYRPLIVP